MPTTGKEGTHARRLNWFQIVILIVGLVLAAEYGRLKEKFDYWESRLAMHTYGRHWLIVVDDYSFITNGQCAIRTGTVALVTVGLMFLCRNRRRTGEEEPAQHADAGDGRTRA